jgi:beta-1,4-mannosyltransferase
MSRPLTVEAEPAFRTRHANPYNARLYTAVHDQGVPVRDLSYLRLLINPPAVVHLHWPDLTFLSGPRRWRHVARLALFFGALRIARLTGTRLVWTVHNLDSHEERSTTRIRAAHRRLLLKNVDAFLSLTEDGLDAARRAYPELRDIPGYVTPHGHYRLDYDLTRERAEARRMLNLPQQSRLLVSAGAIRPYKNIPQLIRSFREREDADSILVIAGKPASPALREEIERAAGDDPRVILDLAFLSNENMALWLRAADLVVLPYHSIQNSGSAILALSAERPVLVPDLGAMRELAEQIGHDWVRLYSGEFRVETLDDAIHWLDTEPRPSAPDLLPLSWDAIASQTIEAYRAVVRMPRARIRRS